MIIGLVLSAASLRAQIPASTIKFENVDPSQALMVYARMSGLTLIEDSRARRIHRTISIHAAAVSKTEAMELIEEALRKQAAIVVTRLDDKSASVTYNDALPIAGTGH
jgi:hypothetical protein